MTLLKKIQAIMVLICSLTAIATAGPYKQAGVNGFIGDDWRHANPDDADAVLNPIFKDWAAEVNSYNPAPDVESGWDDPNKALGQVTGDNFDIVSLGDLNQTQIDQGTPPGQITLYFTEPNHIRDVNGYDFVVFENGLYVNGLFAELAYVEVSSDGNDFARFPSVSLTPDAVGGYGTIDANDILNLAGKHPNAYGTCKGTAFDLSDIADEPNVVSGAVDINNIKYVRIVDIPGSGDFKDQAVKHTDPNSWPDWANYDHNHPIYDAWVTSGSGGFDLEAIGVLNSQNYSADINLDGIVDTDDLHAFTSSWLSEFGDENYNARCNLAPSQDYIINMLDYSVFAKQWLKIENWGSF